MKKLTCKDTGASATCDFEATGETEAEVVGKVMEHAASAHGEAVAAMGLSHDDLQASMAEKVSDDEPEEEEAAGDSETQ